ncbi:MULTISPECIES: hypothetical protein [Vibrio]|uniref:hypothetical protein n=1 Tax=Vibrio TaxID=662 RepID=UPI0014369C2B|nr:MULTISPECIES: hypothetical protein [Vibrio]
MSRQLGRILVSHFYPITTIILETEDEKGNITRKKVKLSNSSELAKEILKARRIVDEQ